MKTINFFQRLFGSSKKQINKEAEAAQMDANEVIMTYSQKGRRNIDPRMKSENHSWKQEKALSYLKEKGSITSWEAIESFGGTRLSSYIFCLREKGHVIETHKVEQTDRFGKRSVFAKYVLVNLK
jgi:tRNA G37 N-methylase Trm5